MKFTIVTLSALFCLQATAASPKADSKSDEALVAAAEQLINESEIETAATEVKSTSSEPAADSKKAELAESEIPVVMSQSKNAEMKDHTIWRLVGSLAVIALTAGGVLYASKRWARPKDKGGKSARIEMMHQLHLGPRKSIGLIRVAGETMLVGITDSNISMIKAVTLIDDELEHVANKDFNGFLEDEFSIEDVRTALTSPRA